MKYTMTGALGTVTWIDDDRASAKPADWGHSILNIDDCSTDPGVLSAADAVFAMSAHHDCPPQCLPRSRALATVDKEFVQVAVKGVHDRLDAQLATTLRELADRITPS
ncbi:hypothetical protein ACIBG0_39105 [Nocardia sp. NPDC050630]|uniref:hypothetical protein n=1 Tax=Nocardia sp. NPDC050630 TaxID=3364321 RepID=UPI00379F796D